jgi:hypothetical protein
LIWIANAAQIAFKELVLIKVPQWAENSGRVLRYIYLDFPDAACDMCKKCDNMHL